jgi:hypothetical protein
VIEGALYYGGYRVPMQGDTIKVYRHDWCIGWIQWQFSPQEPFLWSYSLGGLEGGVAYTLEEAQAKMLECFVLTTDALGLKLDEPSRRPKAEDVNWVEFYRARLATCKTTKDVDEVMAESARRRSELVKLERTQIAHEAGQLFAKLYDIENPQREAAE